LTLKSLLPALPTICPPASLAEVEPIAADPDDVRDLGIIPGFND